MTALGKSSSRTPIGDSGEPISCCAPIFNFPTGRAALSSRSTCRWAIRTISATRKRWPTSTGSLTPPPTGITAKFCCRSSCSDGQPHLLALHGWTGGDIAGDPHRKLYMDQCAVVRSTSRRAISYRRRAWRSTSPTSSTTTIRSKDGCYNALDDAFKVLDTRDPIGGVGFLRQRPGGAGNAQAGDRGVGRADGRRHHRRRARPHRRGVAVDAGADRAQIRAHLQHRAAADGAVPRLHFLAEPGAVVRLHRAELPGAVRADQAARRRRALGGDGRHVGRAGLQRHRRGVAGAPVLAGARLLPPALRRRRYAGALAAGYLRLQLGAAAVDQAGGHEVFHHPQDELEPVQPDAQSDFVVAGAGRHARADALPDHALGLDVFCRTRPPTTRKVSAQEVFGTWNNFHQKETVQRTDHGLWLRRRRRRSHPRDDRERRAAGRLPRRAARALRHDPRVHGAHRRRNRRRAAGLERRVLSGIPSRHLHQPGAQQAQQPQERVSAARRRVSGGAGVRWRPTTPIRTTPSTRRGS